MVKDEDLLVAFTVSSNICVVFTCDGSVDLHTTVCICSALVFQSKEKADYDLWS